MPFLALCLLLALSACSATARAPAAALRAAAAGEILEYRATLASVPASAASIVLHVRIPPSDELRAVQASVLVGNAILELPAAGRPAERANAYASLAWGEGVADGVPARELRVETRGKPLELVVRLERARDGARSREDWERALVLGTRAEADAKPLEGLVTRLERPPGAAAPR